MYFEISSKSFRKALDSISIANLSPKAKMAKDQPYYSAVKISAISENHIKLSAYNGSTFAETIISALVGERGTICLPHTTLTLFCTGRKDITLKVQSASTKISLTRMESIPVTDIEYGLYPVKLLDRPTYFDDPDSTFARVEIDIDSVMIYRILEKLTPCISTQRNYKLGVLGGIHLYQKTIDHPFMFEACDGTVLGQYKIPLEHVYGYASGSEPLNIVIPTKIVNLLTSLSRESTNEQTMHIVTGNSFLQITIGDYFLLTQLSPDPYPDTTRYIPVNKGSSICMRTNDFDPILRGIDTLRNLNVEKSVYFDVHPIDRDRKGNTLESHIFGGNSGSGFSYTLPAKGHVEMWGNYFRLSGFELEKIIRTNRDSEVLYFRFAPDTTAKTLSYLPNSKLGTLGGGDNIVLIYPNDNEGNLVYALYSEYDPLYGLTGKAWYADKRDQRFSEHNYLLCDKGLHPTLTPGFCPRCEAEIQK